MTCLSSDQINQLINHPECKPLQFYVIALEFFFKVQQVHPFCNWTPHKGQSLDWSYSSFFQQQKKTNFFV